MATDFSSKIALPFATFRDLPEDCHRSVKDDMLPGLQLDVGTTVTLLRIWTAVQTSCGGELVVVEKPKFLGVTFRSSGHVLWFVLSLTGLAVASLVAIVFALSRRGGHDGPSPIVVFEYPFWSHFGVGFAALIFTRAGTRQYRSFSIDCIWWNALMAALYGAILLAVWQLG